MADTQTRTSSTVVGYFENQSDAQSAVENLKQAGFTPNQIGLASNYSGESASNTAAGSNAASRTASRAGEKTEGVWDRVKNFFEGGSVEPYADERRQGDFANREVTSTSGYDQGANDYDNYEYGADDFHQSLTGLSVPEQQSRYFGQRFQNSQSGAVVTVTAPGREEEAERILQEAGADLGNNAANYDYSANTGAAAAGAGTAANATSGQNMTGERRNIQLLGEVLRVHKERINRGEVRLRKEIITEQQTIQVPVTREELVIERNPVSGETPAQGQIGQDREIRIPLTEERAAVDKQTVVREQVAVGKRAVEQVRNVGGEVRREELVVDDQSKMSNADRTDTRAEDRTGVTNTDRTDDRFTDPNRR
jgi:uncharacterized protein (TIGR02271 family)